MIEKIGHVCEGKYDSFWPMFMIFFTMSLTGWLWEVCLHLISEFCEPRISSWTVAAYLWFREYTDPDTTS